MTASSGCRSQAGVRSRLGLPIAGAPWLLVLASAALVLAGLGALLRPSVGTTVVILPLGSAMVVAPVALSIPQKASDTSAVLKVGRVALSRFAVTAAHGAALTFDGMVDQARPTAPARALARLTNTARPASALLTRVRQTRRMIAL